MTLKSKMLLGASAVALSAAGCPLPARAQDATALIMQRLDALERENQQLRAAIKRVDSKAAKASTEKAASKSPAQSAVTTAAAAPAPVAGSSMLPTAGNAIITTAGAGYKDGGNVNSDWYFTKKEGPGLTFLTPGGSITLYGQFDVSFDTTTKGIKNKGSPGDRPLGNVGWLPAISTNISYVGVRGEQKIADAPFTFLYQLETQIDISATSGTGESNSNESNVVKGALTSRNSFIGLANAEWGAVKIGKTDAPYKLSTASFNPFSGMLGDYQVIMGNTGGDNRVEFGTRLDHSIWYESPNWGGLKFAALFSPGQNRAKDSSNIAAGESDCTGGNTPLSGGNTIPNPSGACNDGAFSNAISLSATYQKDGFTVLGAYERHFKVNRSSDIVGIYGDLTIGNAQDLYNRDVADEDALKFGLQYKFATKTTVSAIYESMHRYVSADLAFQNERQRKGTWLAVAQELSEKDEVDFGWAHAFRTPGDPGQHNTSTVPTPDGLAAAGGLNPQNQADMITAAYKHKFSSSVLGYFNYATTINANNAHYDLGAGGRGVTTDCHDATGASGGVNATPRCWAGGRLQGFSAGLQYKF